MWAYNEAKRRYATNVNEDILKQYLEMKHIVISNKAKSWFSEAEKERAIDYWNTYQQELFEKIHVQWTYTAPN